MNKQVFLALYLSVFSGTICAQQADPCGGLAGFALGQCQANQRQLQQQQLQQQQLQQQQLQQQQLEQQQKQLQQQLQQQQERQKQLDEQQRQIQDQLENLRLQNEILRKQLEHEKSANQPALPPATDYSKSTDLKSWKSDNPWYGSDYAKTEFAMRYAKQLRQERPDLIGRAFYDAVSAKVNETFGAKK
jgi:septal ring factor EnvC (AmiA/AmiB activator)